MKALIQRLSPYLPLTYTDLIARSLKGCKSVLDIGCGRGELMRSMKRRVNAYSVGLEIYLPYLHTAKKKLSHDGFILADTRRLPIRPKSFDGVLCSQVVEHLNKSEGLGLMEDIERISKSRIIIGTTVGYVPYSPLDPENDNNPSQIHKSGMMPPVFILRGYRVRFQGLKSAYGPKGFIRRFPGSLRPLLCVISYFVAPVVYFAGRLAIYQVARKDV